MKKDERRKAEELGVRRMIKRSTMVVLSFGVPRGKKAGTSGQSVLFRSVLFCFGVKTPPKRSGGAEGKDWRRLMKGRGSCQSWNRAAGGEDLQRGDGRRTTGQKGRQREQQEVGVKQGEEGTM